MSRSPIHPGKVLANELEHLSLTATELARQIDVPPNRISQLVAGKRSLTADTALRLSQFFGTSAESWLDLQKEYDLHLARKEIGQKLEAISPRSKKYIQKQDQKKTNVKKNPQSYKSRQEFMQLSIEERRSTLEHQAQELAQHYEKEDVGSGDFIDY